MTNIRIGQGFDIHRIIPNHPLILGATTIPAPFGLQGHSDADVLLHAITDALLGALALGDIGQWFPDTDPQYKNKASSYFLNYVLQSPQYQDWKIVNLDCTILAEAPKLAPHISTIQKNIAQLCNVQTQQISVKATTMEKLDSIGQKQAIATQAIVLIQQINTK